jgi:hypothetical protein
MCAGQYSNVVRMSTSLLATQKPVQAPAFADRKSANEMRLPKRWLLISVAILAAGCVSHPPYPTGWSPIGASIGTDCAGLSGTFEGHPEDIDKTPWQLAVMLESQNDPSASQFSRFDYRHMTDVRLVVSMPRVTAHLLAGSEEIGMIDLGGPKHSVSCDGRVVTLKQLHGDAAPFAFFGSRHRTLLYRADDNSLVIHAGYSGGGVALVVPVYSSEYHWFRYATSTRSN